jgi:hypothetical protein
MDGDVAFVAYLFRPYLGSGVRSNEQSPDWPTCIETHTLPAIDALVSHSDSVLWHLSRGLDLGSLTVVPFPPSLMITGFVLGASEPYETYNSIFLIAYGQAYRLEFDDR